MTDVKIVEKGVIRAYCKMSAVIFVIYGVIIGGLWLAHNAKKDKFTKEDESEE